MNSFIEIIITLVYIIIVAYLVVKKYQSVYVFLMSGILVLLLYTLVTGNSILQDDSTGNAFIDVFAYVKDTFASNVSGTGLTLMTITGYSVYMSHIGASRKLAYLVTKPLSRIKNPYIVLGAMFIVGALLKLVISSHAGFSMLLMGISFPVLVSLGIGKTSAAAVMVLCGFLDWGPNTPSGTFAADQVIGITIMEYFLKYQLKTGVVLIIIGAIFLPIYLRHMDKKEAALSGASPEPVSVENPDCPVFYAILPTIPLILVTVFSFIPTINMDVVTANLISITLTCVIELFHNKDKKMVTSDFKVMLKAMGNSFAGVVSILIGAAVFAEAIELLGGIAIISNSLAAVKSASIITIILMSLITFFAGILLGSGIASWYAFGPLVPNVASQLGMPIVKIALPMQLSAGIGRCMSPVAGVMIAVSGMAELELTDLVKRCTIPSIVFFICNIFVSYILV